MSRDRLFQSYVSAKKAYNACFNLDKNTPSHQEMSSHDVEQIVTTLRWAEEAFFEGVTTLTRYLVSKAVDELISQNKPIPTLPYFLWEYAPKLHQTPFYFQNHFARCSLLIVASINLYLTPLSYQNFDQEKMTVSFIIPFLLQLLNISVMVVYLGCFYAERLLTDFYLDVFIEKNHNWKKSTAEILQKSPGNVEKLRVSRHQLLPFFNAAVSQQINATQTQGQDRSEIEKSAPNNLTL
jgi:hypothetical protein